MNNFEQTSIEALGISKVYWDGTRQLDILKKVSFSIYPGEGAAVLGPSGCGKTTLLNILSGLDRASEGRVRLLGEDLSGMEENRRAQFINQNVGFVFQFYHLLPEFTALENVLLPQIVWKSASPSQGLKKAKEILARLGLESRLSHYPSELSGGEQQRVAIARALVNDPKILFCDEPTGNLDPGMASQIVEILKNFFKDKNRTVLMVTHDRQVAQMAGRVFDLVAGQWSERSRE